MFVRDFMTHDLITAGVDDPAGATLQRMRDQGLRRMPVLDGEGKLAGMISDRRLLQALAVPTRRGEFRRSVAKPPNLTVGALMNPKVVTTSPDVPLEQAASMMVFNRIGSIVVMEEGAAIGIITETDMFRIFLRLLGGEERGLRVTLRAGLPAFRPTS
ncbi:MAG: CBS domain-containing protein [Caldilineales bacterium]